MDAFKEYIKNFVKYPKNAKNEILVRNNFNNIINKFTKEGCIVLTTSLTMREIYEKIKSVYKDTSILQLTQKRTKLRFKLDKNVFNKKQNYLYIGINKVQENKYYVVCEYSLKDLDYWCEYIARTTPFYNFINEDPYVGTFSIKSLYDKLDKYLISRSSLPQNFIIINLTTLDKHTSTNNNIAQILQCKYNLEVIDSNNKYIYFKLIKSSGTVLYLGVVRFNYENTYVLSFIYHEDLQTLLKLLNKYPTIYKGSRVYNNEELLLHITPKPKSTRQQRTMRTITHTYNTRLKSKMLTK